MTPERKADRYEMGPEIGRGAMGVVRRARDTRLGREVALKMVPAELHHDPELRRRLAQEARAASALNHPGIATVYDFVEEAGEIFIVYEFVEGTRLRERLRSHRFTTEEILELGAQLADALAAAHDRGIIHRDLKPENIMLIPGPERPGRTKILDFGLAKLRQPLAATAASGFGDAKTADAHSSAGFLVGTVEYMSPEQLEREPADTRSDLYALGLVLYEMATGGNPFVGKSPASTISNILKMEPPPVAQRNPVAPAELDRILRKCLRKRPEERYQSARELRVDLANLRRDLGLPAPSPTGVAREAVPTPFAIPRHIARTLLILIQLGYLAMYGAALANLESLDYMELVLPLVVAVSLSGTAVRLYLLSAVALDYPDLGRKFRLLFPWVLLLDLLWAFSPVLLLSRLGLLTLAGSAGLAYLPFNQRWLVYDAYSPSGGRSSGLQPPSYP